MRPRSKVLLSIWWNCVLITFGVLLLIQAITHNHWWIAAFWILGIQMLTWSSVFRLVQYYEDEEER